MQEGAPTVQAQAQTQITLLVSLSPRDPGVQIGIGATWANGDIWRSERPRFLRKLPKLIMILIFVNVSQACLYCWLQCVEVNLKQIRLILFCYGNPSQPVYVGGGCELPLAPGLKPKLPHQVPSRNPSFWISIYIPCFRLKSTIWTFGGLTSLLSSPMLACLGKSPGNFGRCSDSVGGFPAASRFRSES
jgi:hypothetical protein